MTDFYTHKLFGYHAVRDDFRIIFPVSRLVVDPERFVDDQYEPMAAVGMGVIYTKTSNGSVLRDNPQKEEREELLNQYYIPHHKALQNAVEYCLKRYGRSLILDCHSFPALPLPYEKDKESVRPDICIGTDDFHTSQDLCHTVFELIGKAGWSCAVNRPFSGSIVPMEFYRKDRRVSSIMIEVNRRLYMDEITGQKTTFFESCKKRIGLIVAGLRRSQS